MAVTINVNNLTLCHKDSGGISIATLPDVCKTPPNGVPIPYPNIAYARDLAKGTQTVVADGGNMCANYGSEFSKSTGDEAGSIGGVKSGTFIKEATWLTFSFNVRIEGKAACRLTDKMYHNHQNTVNASGLIQRVLATQKLLQKMLCDCDKEVQPTKDDNCLTLGTKKHDCMEKKKAEHNRLGKKPKLDGERGYNKKTGKPSFRSRRDLFERFRKLKELRKKIDTAKTALKATKAGAKVVKLAKFTPVSFVVGMAVDYFIIDPALDSATKQLESMIAEADDIGKSVNDNIFPDGALRGADGKIEGFFEYKFKCPKGVKPGNGDALKGDAVPTWRPGQEENIKELVDAMKVNSPQEIAAEARATLLTNMGC